VDIDLDLGRRSKAGRLAGRLAFLAKAARQYDVFHFNFGQAMLPAPGGWGVDLPLLRALGKRVFMTFQGCDARQTSYCRAHFAVSCCGGAETGPGQCTTAMDAGKRSSIRYAARHCHGLFCVNPDLLHVVPGASFVPYASVDPRMIEVVPPRAEGPVRIVHAPTNRAVKGTASIMAAIESLRGSFDFEWTCLEHLTHAEAMKRYREADLVIDQLRVGWYGALAVEIMAMGKPVVCYVRESDLGGIPPAMRDGLPLIQATPDTIAPVLRETLAHRERLTALGASGRAFVERWHDPRRIAGRLLEVYADPSRGFWAGGDELPAA
jgi:hypothetical protein